MKKILRRPILAGNWKMNKSLKEALELVTILKRALHDLSADLIVCPPYTALSEVAEVLRDSDIAVGAQDLFWEEKGAFTGEVSAAMILDAGAAYVIIGHSERRQFFHETNDTVHKKILAALQAGLFPIVCVGESLKEREKNETFAVLEAQLKGAFPQKAAMDFRHVVMAYEPVWAIGTGKVATTAQAQEAHHFIRAWWAKRFGEEAAQALRIQYGGSVKPENIGDLMRQEDIDGALVGGASLDAQSFIDIAKNAVAATVMVAGGGSK